ncbi:ATP-dependent RNA helicase MSS116 [Xylaria bambusicola]|uniref:ATP-dependent RNA helicase MSS116 n=1 Tax=Xylaria bambusicola TaxID=326684 RepID=UPI002008C4F3|nr:ATP-dependent RNA helicase MSS116 [Xylaria bambusicola]KAI0506871.1 ATP-dependent RNA helicase MSS116 [Xylaria bambusicola]
MSIPCRKVAPVLFSIPQLFILRHSSTLTRNFEVDMTGRQNAKSKPSNKWRGKGASTHKPGKQATRHTHTGTESHHESHSEPSKTVTGSTAPLTAPLTVPLTVPESSTEQKFSDLMEGGLVHPTLLRTITEDLKFEHMTPVQAATIRPILTERSDILAQAKTGTGKTVAFLLPALQNLVNRNVTPGSAVSLLVITPTRELALQIAAEAEALLQRLPQYKVCIAIGGTNKDAEERRILRGCDILIGTPGRLFDHLGGDGSPVVEKLQQLDTLVLDEADRLLDMGFLPSLKQIVACLPNRTVKPRQGMLFSATVPEYVSKVSGLVLSKDHKYISTIQKGEINTHERVPQQLIIVPEFSDVTAALLGALRQEQRGVGAESFKAIVFAPTAALVNFYVDVLQQFPDMPTILSLHARMTQSKRTNVTQQYRQARSGIMVATDVIARGMDFPAVTNVFQVGIPSDKESYVHRLGRTARAGAEGRGSFIISSHETWFSKWELKGIDFNEHPADLAAQDDIKRITMGMNTQGKTYQAWLGFYKSYVKRMGWDNVRLVAEANTFALDGLGAPEVPSLEKSTVGKMGLRGVKGLSVIKNRPRE